MPSGEVSPKGVRKNRKKKRFLTQKGEAAAAQNADIVSDDTGTKP
jgi:hypothetical protein